MKKGAKTETWVSTETLLKHFYAEMSRGRRKNANRSLVKKQNLNGVTPLRLSSRSRADLNRCSSFCRAEPSHSATGPFKAGRKDTD